MLIDGVLMVRIAILMWILLWSIQPASASPIHISLVQMLLIPTLYNLSKKGLSQNGNIRDFIMLVYIIPDNAKCIGNGAQSGK